MIFFTIFDVIRRFCKNVFKVTCRVQIWKRSIFQNNKNFNYSFVENDIIYMYLPFIYKTPIVLRLSKIVTLNFTMYVLVILTCFLK